VKAELRDLAFPREGREVDALRSLGSNARLALSPQWMEPAVVGVLRPVLVLPSGIASKLSDAQLHAILAHELSHLRRRDNLGANLHTIVEAVFWFHPRRSAGPCWIEADWPGCTVLSWI
jgi:bla regulator protein blaR1